MAVSEKAAAKVEAELAEALAEASGEETTPAPEPVVDAERDERKAAQAKVVKKIIAMRKGGHGYPAIAKSLNEAGVPTFGKGKTWHPPVVRGICIRELGGADESLKLAGTTRPGTKKAETRKAAASSRRASTGRGRQAQPDPKKGSTRRRPRSGQAGPKALQELMP